MTQAIHSMFLGLLITVTFFLSPHDTFGSSHTNSHTSFDCELSRPVVGVVFGEQYDPDLGLYYLRARFYNPQTGRFWSTDSWEGKNKRPSSLNKYGYCEGDPVNHVDPSGHSMSLGGAMTGGAIAGSLAGLTTGVVMGIRENGTVFHRDTAKQAIIGLFGGAAVGAMIGGAVYLPWTMLRPVLQTGFRQLWRKLLNPAGHKKTKTAIISGFVIGFALGVMDPDLVVTMSVVFVTATTAIDDAIVRGAIWRRNELARILGNQFHAHARHVLFRYAQATTFVALGFAAGFTMGHTTGALIRRHYDAAFAE